MPIQQPNRSIPPTSQHANRYTSLSSLRAEIRSLVAQRKRVFAYQWVSCKDERHAAYIHVYICSDGERFYEWNEINRICTPSSRNYRFFVRARRWKIWVTRANASFAWKFVSGMFVGIVAVAPRAWKREESRFRGLSVDALSNTRLTLWVTDGRNAASSYMGA